MGLRRLCIVLMLLLVSGCGSVPQRQSADEAKAEQVALPVVEPVASEPAVESVAPESKQGPVKVVSPSMPVVPSPSEPEPEASKNSPEAIPATKANPSVDDAMGFSTAGEIPVTERELKEKVMYANLMLSLSPGKRILASDNQEAKDLLAKTKIKAAEAKVKLSTGDLKAANELVNESYRLMSMAAALVPSAHQLAMEKGRYPELLQGLKHAKDLFHENYTRVVKKSDVTAYDEAKVVQLEKQADSLVIKGNYPVANKRLEEARTLVDVAIMEMLNNQTVVYAVDVSTPEKEFKYEYGRYSSYEELIPVAIEMKKPSKGQMMLVNRHIKKARWMSEQAKQTADQGDYPKAIRMIMDAGVEVRKALKLMKVETFE